MGGDRLDILVIQSSPIDPIGLLGEFLAAKGAKLHPWLPLQSPQPPVESDYQSLIVLGGSMHAADDVGFPHLRQVVDLIRQFHAAGKPVMGICLGAQLIARTFGAWVYPHSAPELGFTPVNIHPEVTLPWLKALPPQLHLMQWHFDTFDLPPKATLLMSNSTCRHQAYCIGPKVYGFQFHLEVTPAIVKHWLADKSDWIADNYPNLDQTVLQQLQDHWSTSTCFANALATQWIDLIKSSTSAASAV
ncbi:MAG: type 1 glutamine amidotransferase [Cyanobacteria bacterium P01_A01_bin.135]